MSKIPRHMRKAFDDKALSINPKFKKQLLSQITQGESMTKKITTPKTAFASTRRLANFAAVIVVLAVVGSASAAASKKHTTQAQLRSVALPQNLSDVVPIDTVRATAATENVSGTAISGVELENEEGILVYKVTFSDGTRKLYDAKTGKLVTSTTQAATIPSTVVASIDLQTARTTAQNQKPNGTITKIELETENGVAVYSVRFSDDSRIDINAVDGTIIRQRDGDDQRESSSSSSDDSNDDENETEHENESEKSSSQSGSTTEKEDDDSDKSSNTSGSNSGSGSSGSGKSGSGKKSDD